jgi:major membrane immunogen (membrane-anchored lipoprotein)
MRNVIVIPAVLSLALCLTACGEKTYADGTYQGRSANYVNEDGDTSGNGYGVVNLTVSGGQITACEYKTYELDGTLKDEDYGKENGEIKNKDFFNKAQKARAACDNYAQQLVAKQNLKDVDAVSGATVNYREFQEAVEDALKQAEQK